MRLLCHRSATISFLFSDIKAIKNNTFMVESVEWKYLTGEQRILTLGSKVPSANPAMCMI